MRIITTSELETSKALYQDVAGVLQDNGIICFPTNTTYRLATNFLSERAVINFMQVKRRTKKSPTLVFIPHREVLPQIVESIPPQAERLMEIYWPGALTLLFHINPDLPRKLIRNLNSNGKVGVRIPESPIAQEVVQAFGGPVLISSANLSRKVGAGSVAQIRKNFGRGVNLMVNAGDLNSNKSSTVIDVTGPKPVLVRPGEISLEEILPLWEGVPPLSPDPSLSQNSLHE